MDEQLFPQGPAPSLQNSPPAMQGISGVQGMPAQPLVPLGAQITNLATRVKLAEERYANLAKRNQLTEGGLLSFEREMKTDLRVLTQQTVELRKRVAEMSNKLDAMTGELGAVVRKHEFTTLERFLDMWQPMSFVTRDEARKIVEDAIRDATRGSANGPGGS